MLAVMMWIISSSTNLTLNLVFMGYLEWKTMSKPHVVFLLQAIGKHVSFSPINFIKVFILALNANQKKVLVYVFLTLFILYRFLMVANVGTILTPWYSLTYLVHVNTLVCVLI